MDIGALPKLRAPLETSVVDATRRNQNSDPDRDANGRQEPHPEKPKQLTPEQEDAAVEKLNSLPSFKASGLIAKLVRENGNSPIVVIEDSHGKILKTLTYDQLIENYLHRNDETTRGRLLNRAA